MPAIGRNNDAVDGGQVIGSQIAVLVNGQPIASVPDSVTPHGPPPHALATMAQGFASILVNGRPVCFDGALATCGDSLTATATNIIGTGTIV